MKQKLYTFFNTPHTGERFYEALDAFIAHRKEKRNPVTPTSAKMLGKLLSQYPEPTAIEMLETAIRNGWQGVFPPRNGTALFEPTEKEEAFGALVGRKHGDRISQQERAAIESLGEVSEDEFDTMESFYNAVLPEQKDARRQTLLSLIQNWTGELDKARAWSNLRK